MSAPDTNIDKQVKRHKGPLFGMGLGVSIAAVLFLGLLALTFANADDGEVPATPSTVLED